MTEAPGISTLNRLLVAGRFVSGRTQGLPQRIAHGRPGAKRASIVASSGQRSGVVLIGYSTGADAMPFVVNRLPPSLRSQVRLVVLIGPYGTANFNYRWVDWLNAPPPPGAHETLPEILSSAQYGLPTLCIHGVEEKGSLCPQLAGTFVRVVTLPGGHHFRLHFTRVAHVILQSLDSGAGAGGAGTATATSTRASP